MDVNTDGDSVGIRNPSESEGEEIVSHHSIRDNTITSRLTYSDAEPQSR